MPQVIPDLPQVMAIILIDEPEGIYYGGTIAAPVIQELFNNILPYMGIEPNYKVEIPKDTEEGTLEFGKPGKDPQLDKALELLR